MVFATQKLHDNLQECAGTKCTIMKTNLSLEKLVMDGGNSICQPKVSMHSHKPGIINICIICNRFMQQKKNISCCLHGLEDHLLVQK
jgi:hypothetical protein